MDDRLLTVTIRVPRPSRRGIQLSLGTLLLLTLLVGTWSGLIGKHWFASSTAKAPISARTGTVQLQPGHRAVYAEFRTPNWPIQRGLRVGVGLKGTTQTIIDEATVLAVSPPSGDTLGVSLVLTRNDVERLRSLGGHVKEARLTLIRHEQDGG